MLAETYRHSASGANMFLASPSHFVWKYGFNQREPVNPRMNMGTASEYAAYESLMGNFDDGQAQDAAIAKFDELQEGEITPERGYVGPITVNFLTHLRKHGQPLTYQSRLSKKVSELNIEVIGFTDFGYDNLIVDTKATLRCPTNINNSFAAGAVRQQAVYSKITGKNVALLYATPNRSEFFPVNRPQIEAAWNVMIGAWKCIEKIAKICPTAEEATKIIPLNPDSFYWKDETYSKANERWKSC